MPEFSFEKYKEAKEIEESSPGPTREIKAVERILSRGPDLFTGQDQGELEKLRQLYPDEYQAVKDMEPFYDLNPEQQKEVLKRIEKEGIEAFIRMRQGKPAEVE